MGGAELLSGTHCSKTMSARIHTRRPTRPTTTPHPCSRSRRLHRPHLKHQPARTPTHTRTNNKETMPTPPCYLRPSAPYGPFPPHRPNAQKLPNTQAVPTLLSSQSASTATPHCTRTLHSAAHRTTAPDTRRMLHVTKPTIHPCKTGRSLPTTLPYEV